VIDTAGLRIKALLQDMDVEQYARDHPGDLGALGPADSDSWLDVTADDVEAMWRQRAGAGAGAGIDGEVAGAEEAVQAMQAFLTAAQSDYEGVEAPGDVSFDVAGLLDSLRGVAGDELNEPDELDDFLGDDLEESLAADFSEYFDDMGRELAGTAVTEGFVTGKDARAMAGEAAEGPSTGPEDDETVHVELNLLKNMLQSYSAQQGLAGPVSNVMRSLGIALPEEDNDSDEDDE
jgi:hypothetical protein